MNTIALLTDFGLQDEYVGVMKGVIHSINPNVSIIDISHNVSPHDLHQASLMITSGYAYFPPQTIFVVVVDPGVGSKRRIFAARWNNYYFLCPDNGILSLLFKKLEPQLLIAVENTTYYLNSISQTFHGRDIFAPVAAHISKGVPLTDLGPSFQFNDLTVLNDLKTVMTKQTLYGCVQYIDHFGNLVTNIGSETWYRFIHQVDTAQLALKLKSAHVRGLSDSYADVAPGNLLAILGSRNFIEISVNCGNAQKLLEAKIGDTVVVERCSFME